MMTKMNKDERLALAKNIIAQSNAAPKTRRASSADLASRSPEYREGRKKAIAYIGAARTRSTGAVRQKLERVGLAPDVITEVITALCADNYIDDKRAAAHVMSKFSGRKQCSRHTISQLLGIYGVADDVIAELMAKSKTDPERIREVCAAEAKCKNRRSPENFRLYLLGRGFEPEVIVAELGELGE